MPARPVAIAASAGLRARTTGLLSKLSLGDETLEGPLELLARYRQLCEAAGAAESRGGPIPRSMVEELGRVEGELRARLWLASREASGRTPSRPTPRSEHDPFPEPGMSAPRPSVLDTPSEPLTGRATVYCDGACIGNPGPGGYGALVRVPGHPEQTLSGGKARTTNNEMEMTGAVAGLRLALSLGATEVNVVSDSEYLVKGMTSWVRGWLRNGWKTRAGDPVKNRALWEELHALSQGCTVSWSWTRGHSGHPENERCDQLAMAAAQRAADGLPSRRGARSS